jgi:hypothetical protein
MPTALPPQPDQPTHDERFTATLRPTSVSVYLHFTSHLLLFQHRFAMEDVDFYFATSVGDYLNGAQMHDRE